MDPGILDHNTPQPAAPVELLPYDGSALYFGSVFSERESDHYLNLLQTDIIWKQDQIRMFGKVYITRRMVAWYGDNSLEYIYSGNRHTALPWHPVLTEIRDRIQILCGESFNACLLNLYNDGMDGMGWHADNEPTIEQGSAIASVSFGAARKFSFRHISGSPGTSVILEHGSLLLMKGTTQDNWLHTLPKTKKVKSVRINLTFRQMKPQVQGS